MKELRKIIRAILMEDVQNNNITALSEEGKKYFPKLKIADVILKARENPETRVFFKGNIKGGSFSIGGFKNYLASYKIYKVADWLAKKGKLKDLVYSRTTNSIYFTMGGFPIRISDHKKGSFEGFDILVTWNTTPQEIVAKIKDIFS
jgi:hypothetical protein